MRYRPLVKNWTPDGGHTWHLTFSEARKMPIKELHLSKARRKGPVNQAMKYYMEKKRAHDEFIEKERAEYERAAKIARVKTPPARKTSQAKKGSATRVVRRRAVEVEDDDDTMIANELPYNDYFEYFGPDFKLHISPSNMGDQNASEYMDKIKTRLFENLRMLPHAPRWPTFPRTAWPSGRTSTTQTPTRETRSSRLQGRQRHRTHRARHHSPHQAGPGPQLLRVLLRDPELARPRAAFDDAIAGRPRRLRQAVQGARLREE